MVADMTGRFLAAALICLVAIFSDARAQTTRAQSHGRQAGIVVELFTSQGCVQCPRANRLLGTYVREPDVLALTYPVGIWDYLGWEDTLARPQFTDRQRAYSESLRERRRTPQLVLNGARQINASDWDEARLAFEQMRASGWPAPLPQISMIHLRNGPVRVAIGAAPREGAAADVWLVAYDSGPITVEVTRGANRNRSVPHYNLVDRIERIGGWTGAPIWFERSRCSPKCAVIIQEPDGGRIITAAYVER